MDSIIATKAYAARVVQSSSAAGAIKLDGFDSLFSDKDNEIVLIDGIRYEEEDVVLPVVALDDERVLYSFGKNFGKFSLVGTIYITKCQGSGFTSKVKAVQDAFNSARVSASTSPRKLSAFKMNPKVYVVGMTLGQANPSKQTIAFSIDCIVAPVKNKGG